MSREDRLAKLNNVMIPCACGCGKEIPPYNRAFHRRYYAFGHSPASKEQRYKAPLGKPFSQEHKDKISLALKSKPKSPEHIRHAVESKIASGVYKGVNNPFYGKKHTPESRAKMSLKSKGRIQDKNPNWRGGAKQLPYHPNFTNGFKKLIRQRDGNKCQRCGKTRKREGKELSVHHIDHDKMNNDPSNLVTVCGRCNTYFSAHRNKSLEAFPRRKMLLI